MARIPAALAATLALLSVAGFAGELTPPVLAPSAYSATSPLVATNGRAFLRLSAEQHLRI